MLDQAGSMQASPPNKYCDPKIAAQLYDKIWDEYRLCVDIGLNAVTNENHSGIILSNPNRVGPRRDQRSEGENTARLVMLTATPVLTGLVT